MVYESGQPQMIDTDECWRKEGVVLCQGETGQNHEIAMLAQEGVMFNGCQGIVQLVLNKVKNT